MITTMRIVKDGVIVPNIPIPEGFRVEITFHEEQLVFTPEEQAEFDMWRRAGEGTIEMVERLA